MSSQVNLVLPNLDDPADITVLVTAIQNLADAYNAHMNELETAKSLKVSLLTQIVGETSLYNSDVSSLFSFLNEAATNDDKIVILEQLVNEIALFETQNAANILNQLNNT